jgi:hypothetical protein
MDLMRSNATGVWALGYWRRERRVGGVRWGALAPHGAWRARDGARVPMAEPIYRPAMVVRHAKIFLPNLDILSFSVHARSQGSSPQCGLVPMLMSGSGGAHSWWSDRAGASRRVAMAVCLSLRYLEGKRESEAERLRWCASPSSRVLSKAVQQPEATVP